MILKGDSLPPPKELTAPVQYDDWKEVEAFADRHFELYAQTHLGRYSFKMADKRKEWNRTMKNELRVSELQELDFTQFLEKERGEFLVPISVLGPLHPAGAPPVEPFFPIDKRNGRDPVWTDAIGFPWVVYPDGRSDLLLERPLGGPRIKERERLRELQTRQALAGRMAKGTRKTAEEAKKMEATFGVPEPKFVPKSPQQLAIRSAAMRRTARQMDCSKALIMPFQFPPRDKLSASPSYLMEGLDYKDTINVLNFDQDSRAANAAKFRRSGRARRHSVVGPFPDSTDPHCPVDEVYADGEPCDPMSMGKDADDEIGVFGALWRALFGGSDEPPCPENPDEFVMQETFEEEGADVPAGKLKPVEAEAPFPFSSYSGYIPAKHVLKYTWKSEVQGGSPGGGLNGGAGMQGGAKYRAPTPC